MSVATALLDFLLSLFRDPAAAAAFSEDPEKALDEAGLGGVCMDDVDAVMPVLLDYGPVAVGNREYNTGGNHVPAPAGEAPRHHHDDDDHGHAVQQITHLVHNYSYTSYDDRDTVTDQSVNQNIWANGDVTQLFDQNAIIASGDQAVAAGDDADVDQSDDHSTNIDAGGDVHIGDDNSLDLDLTDSFNDNSDNSDNSDHSDNSDNSDNSVTVGDIAVDNSEDNDGLDIDGDDNLSDNFSDNFSDNEVDASDNSTTDNSQDNDGIDVGGDVSDNFSDNFSDNVTDNSEDNDGVEVGGDVSDNFSDNFNDNFSDNDDNFSDNFSDNEAVVEEATTEDAAAA